MAAELKSDSSKIESERLMSENCDAPVTLTDDRHECCARNGRNIIITSKQDLAISKEDEIFDDSRRDTFNKKKWSYSPLIPMRVTIFLWFGAGRVPGLFLSVFMMQKGLSLVEFSTIFSVTFVFQFLCAATSGIIADKIGNSKPVLMFLMLSTMITVICMVLAPTVNSESCVRDNQCSGAFRGTSRKNLYLNLSCFEKDTKHFQLREIDIKYERNSSIERTNVASFCDIPDHEDEISNATNCFFIYLSDMLENETSLNCSSLCLNYLNNTETTCSESENKYVVIIYSILIILFFSFWSTTFRFIDITVMGLVNKYDTYYGKERFVQLLGELSAATLVTFVLSSSADKNYYDSVYCFSASGIFLAFISAVFIRDQINPPGRNMTKKALKLIQNVDVMIFFLVVFILGNSYCFNQNFHLWFLHKLKAPKILLGLHGIMYSIYGIPLLLTSEWWLKKLGPRKIFVLSLLCYSFNAFSYSFIYNPWISLSLEWTTAFSYHLLWISVVVHSYKIAPQGLFATVNALCGVLHFAIGRSSSNFGGGLLIHALGPRTTYRIFGTICIVTSILYSAFIYRSRLSSVKASDYKSAEREEIKV